MRFANTFNEGLILGNEPILKGIESQPIEDVYTVQYAGDEFVLLAPLEPTEDLAEDELLILKISENEQGEEVYVSVEDDDLVEKVFNLYLAEAEADE